MTKKKEIMQIYKEIDNPSLITCFWNVWNNWRKKRSGKTYTSVPTSDSEDIKKEKY